MYLSRGNHEEDIKMKKGRAIQFIQLTKKIETNDCERQLINHKRVVNINYCFNSS